MTAPPIVDAVEREAALDPARSFIVQAPAGSGKTGLLIQRYLRLLARVDRPEETLAITFTRKAAAEMRRRVLGALQTAASGEMPRGANAALTARLAKDALERDRARGWRLLENAARLRIQTIDSLCAALARQMPVLSRLGAPPAIVEDAAELYREAAERTLGRVESAEPVARAVARLLRHLDGDWASARGLIELMLARRDQWIRRVAGFHADEEARAALEQAFRSERARLMRHVRALVPAAEEETLARLAHYAAGNVAKADPESPIARLEGLARLPPASEEGAQAWRGLAALLLVSGGAQLRKSVDKRTGFPPGDRGVDAVFKKQMTELLKERLALVPGLAEALDGIRRMPPPRYTDAQWEVLGAMVAILPRAFAELQLVFAERGRIDFHGLAEGAVRALGEEDAPTDLLLTLDLNLRHLLVDEFQDTSIAQWELLTRLTAGWCEGDGRTVFLVGDPMQSIYRFREADVALFLRARQHGLPSVALTGVNLATNFRSQGAIVAWVNRAFGPVLAPLEDADSGAVPYAPSSPHHPERPGVAVQWHAFAGADPRAAREAEAARVAELAAAALAEDGAQSVAILVRNRSHLDRIVPALKAAGIRYRAVDIDPLGQRPAMLDLLAITRALIHPADRIAWLALLRAPWCALGLADLHALAGGALSPEGARPTVWELLHDAARLACLSPEGRERLLRLRERLSPAVESRLRGTLRERVEAAWLALCAPACAERASDLEDAETFFDQLDALEECGELRDAAVLEEHLAGLYAAPDSGDGIRVQLMTIHKAKGLEFGTVIVPGLDRLPRASDKPLFAWKARADGTLMMAPVRATGEANEAAYDYLCELDRTASEHEVARLLYVAVTRAERRLHLLGYARLEEKGRLKEPSARSLLGKAWHVAHEHFEKVVPQLAPAGDADGPGPRVHELRMLDAAVFGVRVPAIAWRGPGQVADEAPRIEFSWAGETARHVGTVTHRWLQRIALEGLAAWDAARVRALAPRIARDLARRGIPPREAPSATERVLHALEGALGDPRGRWVLDRHPLARSECRLRIAGREGVRLVVIDRMFRDNDGVHWIVDYKTSRHEGAALEAFLDSERERYRGQLEGYARALKVRPGPKLGLYFPMHAGWREWESEPE